MKKATFITALILAAALTGCGKTGSGSSSEKTTAASSSTTSEASSETSSEASSDAAEAGTEAVTNETTLPAETQAATQGSASADYTWFNRGVYKTTVDGNTGSYYVFTSASEGKVTSTTGGVPFTCEQTKGSINFHKGGVSESEIMTMSAGENGSIIGVSGGRTWVFTLLEGVSPDDFDASVYESAAESGQNPIMNYIGNYSNGRATMNVAAKGKNGAEINISWGSSANATSFWHMTGDCTVNGDTITVSYSDCVRTDSVDGGGTIAYEGGTGKVVFGSTVKWQPDTESYSEDNLTFTYIQ